MRCRWIFGAVSVTESVTASAITALSRSAYHPPSDEAMRVMVRALVCCICRAICASDVAGCSTS